MTRRNQHGGYLYQTYKQQPDPSTLTEAVPNLVDLFPLPFLEEYLYNHGITNYLVARGPYVLLDSSTRENVTITGAGTGTGAAARLYLNLNDDLTLTETVPRKDYVLNGAVSDRMLFHNNIPSYVGNIYVTVYFQRKQALHALWSMPLHASIKTLLVTLFTDAVEPRNNGNVINKLMFSCTLGRVLPVIWSLISAAEESVAPAEPVPAVVPKKTKTPALPKAYHDLVHRLNLRPQHDLLGVLIYLSGSPELIRGLSDNHLRAILEQTTERSQLELDLTVYYFTTLRQQLLPLEDILARTKNAYDLYDVMVSARRQERINKTLMTSLRKTLDRSLADCYTGMILELVWLTLLYRRITQYSRSLQLPEGSYNFAKIITTLYVLERVSTEIVTFPINREQQLTDYFGRMPEVVAERMSTGTIIDRISKSSGRGSSGSGRGRGSSDTKTLKHLHTHILYRLYGSASKHGYRLVKQSRFYLRGMSISDCGESTTLNIINALIWDPSVRDINITFLPASAHPALKYYYKHHPTISRQSNQKFAELTIGHPGIEYVRHDAEIVPTDKNIIRLLLILLNFPDFESAVKTCAAVSSNGTERYSLSAGELRFPSLDVTFRFTPKHAYGISSYRDQTDHNELMEFIRLLPESYRRELLTLNYGDVDALRVMSISDYLGREISWDQLDYFVIQYLTNPDVNMSIWSHALNQPEVASHLTTIFQQYPDLFVKMLDSTNYHGGMTLLHYLLKDRNCGPAFQLLKTVTSDPVYGSDCYAIIRDKLLVENDNYVSALELIFSRKETIKEARKVFPKLSYSLDTMLSNTINDPELTKYLIAYDWITDTILESMTKKKLVQLRRTGPSLADKYTTFVKVYMTMVEEEEEGALDYLKGLIV